MHTRALLFALAASASLATAPAVFAQEADGVVVVAGNSVVVHFGDLNLASERGVAVLDSRIRRAVKTVCGGQPESNVIFGSPMRQCQRVTLANLRPTRDRVLADARSTDPSRLTAATLTIVREDG